MSVEFLGFVINIPEWNGEKSKILEMDFDPNFKQ